MAKQLTVQFQLYGELAPNDLDRIAYELSLSLQRQIPCKVLGYGVVDILSAMPQSFTITGVPGIVDAIEEQSAPIKMMG